jgi:ATP-binding cassette subfamily B multidrug efflux pump
LASSGCRADDVLDQHAARLHAGEGGAASGTRASTMLASLGKGARRAARQGTEQPLALGADHRGLARVFVGVLQREQRRLGIEHADVEGRAQLVDLGDQRRWRRSGSRCARRPGRTCSWCASPAHAAGASQALHASRARRRAGRPRRTPPGRGAGHGVDDAVDHRVVPQVGGGVVGGEMLSRALPMVAQSIMTIVACLFMMLMTDLLLTGVVLGFAVLIFFFTKFAAKRSSRYFIQQQIELGKTNGYIEEMINGQRVVKVFNYEERNIAGFNAHNDAFFTNSVKANRYASILMPTVNQLGNIQYALIALLGGLAITQGVTGYSLTGAHVFQVGIIVSFLLYSKSFTQPIGQVSQQLNVMALALAGATRIFEVIDAPSEVDDGYVELVNAKADANGDPIEVKEHTGHWAWKHPHKDGSPTTYVWVKGKITFDHVDFAYIPGKTVLHDITLYAKPGQKVAFVGPTGAGKTTITNLINRFYDIEDGKIRYDDININKIKKTDLRRSLGVVLQDVKLFTGTVKENIRYGKLDATDEEVVAAAKLANADSFIRNLPQGYDTVLEAGGASLSQGQRQLLSIARCAVADPPVMILDEATSSIDSRTEKLVQQGMDEIMKGRTVFVIAHRLSTIQNADVIMVLEKGTIIERGNHQQLLDLKGKYYQLYTGGKVTSEE